MDSSNPHHSNRNNNSDRRIVRPTPHSPGTYATIVGFLPKNVSSITDDIEDIDSGRLDFSSGLSIVCIHNNSSRSAICIWENVTSTLAEDWKPRPKCSIFYTPYYATKTRVTLHPLIGGGTTTTPHKKQLVYFSLYAASSNGIVSFWNNAQSSDHNNTPKQPDASIQLPLFTENDGEEKVTFLQSLPSISAVVAGTTHGRLFQITCLCSWPLQLEYQELIFNDHAKSTRKSGMFSTFLLSSFLSSSSTITADTNRCIVGIFPWLPETRVDDIQQSSLYATPLRPSQRARLFHMPPQQSFLFLTKNFEFTKVSIPSNTKEVAEAETVSLLVELRNYFLQQGLTQETCSLFKIKIIHAALPQQHNHSNCLFLLVQVSWNESQRRLYIIQFALTAKPFASSIVNGQWLNKYPSESIPFLSCKGFDAVPQQQQEEDEEELNNDHVVNPYLVYSTWLSNKEERTVTCSAVYFPAADANTNYTSSSNNIRNNNNVFDMELPKLAAPNVIGTGTAATSEGTFLMTTDKLISVVIKMDWRATVAKHSLLISSPTSSLTSPNVQTLIQHLSDAFYQYASSSSTSHTTDVSIVASLPPSLLEARTSALNVATEHASWLLLSDTTRTTDIKQKLKTHQLFVNFLNHAGLYRKLTSCRCKLMDHGEMVQCCITLLENKCQGLGEDPTNVLSKLCRFQEDTIRLDDADTLGSAIRNVSETICCTLESANKYRKMYMEVLYDVPSQGSSDYVSPWTSSNEMRSLLLTQLRHIAANRVLSSTDSETTKHAVRILGNNLLQGYLEDDGKGENKYEFSKQYHQAKVESISLFQLYLSNQDALNASVQHQYFDGIVQICEEEELIFSDYFRDLLLKNDWKEDLVHGKTFPGFVFSYFCAEGQFANVLDLGLYCKEELQLFLESDPRMHDYRWINDFRQGKFEDGADCLSRICYSAKGMTHTNGASTSAVDIGVLLSLSKLAEIVSEG